MDFKQLRSFVAVINCGSFTAAASRLRVSQPTISTHVRMLEEELGKPLVLRTAKRADLAPGAQKTYEQAVSILSLYDRMQDVRVRESDTIYIGASSIPSGYILPAALAQFSQQHPDAKFVVSQDDSQAVINGLLDGLVDIGFTGMVADEDSLECVSFYSDKMVLATPATDAFRSLALKDSAAVAKLLSSNHVVMRRWGSATRETSDRLLDELGIKEHDLDIVAYLDDQESIKNLVEHGFGLTLISDIAVRDRVEEGRLLSFDIPDVDARREFYVVRRKNVLLDSCAEDFFAFIRLYCSSL